MGVESLVHMHVWMMDEIRLLPRCKQEHTQLTTLMFASECMHISVSLHVLQWFSFWSQLQLAVDAFRGKTVDSCPIQLLLFCLISQQTTPQPCYMHLLYLEGGGNHCVRMSLPSVLKTHSKIVTKCISLDFDHVPKCQCHVMHTLIHESELARLGPLVMMAKVRLPNFWVAALWVTGRPFNSLNGNI